MKVIKKLFTATLLVEGLTEGLFEQSLPVCKPLDVIFRVYLQV